VGPTNRRNALLVGLVVVFLLAISLAGTVRAAPQNQDVPATPTPRGVVLFSDDFATYSGRWQEKSSPKASAAYGESALSLRVVSPGVAVWSVPDFDTALHDYRAEVLVDFRDGSPDSLFGLVLDYQDDENFYALMTTSQGEWQFARRQNDEWIDLTPPDAVPLERETGESVIRLRADVIGGTVTFFVDEQAAGRVTVEDDLSGAVFGLIARAGRGYVDVSFDDFVVTAWVGE
jgi:hypothetical protein